jgi:hypothetical protein
MHIYPKQQKNRGRKRALFVARPMLELRFHAPFDPPLALRLEQLPDTIPPLVARAEIPEHGRVAPSRWWSLFVHITTVEPPSRDGIARNC